MVQTLILASEIFPRLETSEEKERTLWKAIHQLKGDIICYVDADISQYTSTFCVWLVAPLIKKEEVQYVKAFYDQPTQLLKWTPLQRRRTCNRNSDPPSLFTFLS